MTCEIKDKKEFLATIHEDEKVSSPLKSDRPIIPKVAINYGQAGDSTAGDLQKAKKKETKIKQIEKYVAAVLQYNNLVEIKMKTGQLELKAVSKDCDLLTDAEVYSLFTKYNTTTLIPTTDNNIDNNAPNFQNNNLEENNLANEGINSASDIKDEVENWKIRNENEQLYYLLAQVTITNKYYQSRCAELLQESE